MTRALKHSLLLSFKHSHMHSETNSGHTAIQGDEKLVVE